VSGGKKGVSGGKRGVSGNFGNSKKQNDCRMAAVQQISEIGWGLACKKKKISNVDHRMSNAEV
jgi:hypothetical protein